MKNKFEDHGGAALTNMVKDLYADGQSDYGLEPIVRIDSDGNPMGRIADGDSVIFCCRRGEREIELTDAFVDKKFTHFERREIENLFFVILTLYHEKFKDLPVAFAPTKIKETLAEVISNANLRQLHCAESEKFAHVTFFFNGGNNQAFQGESDERIPSPRGISFEKVPQLSLPAVVAHVKEGLAQNINFIVTNFANGDVIGHTQNKEAKIACAEFIDQALEEVVEDALKKDYVVFITADHGNLEILFTENGQPHVSHTTNLVPFIAIDPHSQAPLSVADGKLADIAPTILGIMGLGAPMAMTGSSLLPDWQITESRKVILIILDGWGMGPMDESNPIFQAKTPYWDSLLSSQTIAVLEASGESVGLKEGKTGNSEAGHINIGAGRVVLQDDVRLDRALQNGTFFENEVFLEAIDHAKHQKSALHLLALLTEKSSHGSIDYPLALLKLAKQEKLEDVFIHVIFDGRSTPPGSAPQLLEKFDRAIKEIGVGQIVTGVGRGLALDRDGNYNKIERVYDALVFGKARLYR